MRYGSQQSYDDEALGKFGLGLKTASLSQCRRLTVASRTHSSKGSIEIRQLDLDHVVDSNRWEIFDLSRCDRETRLVEPLKAASGTVVLWESLDRVLGYKIPWGKRAETALAAMADQLVMHLGMTFHRFVSGEISERGQVRMLVNGSRIKPWDPFATSEHATVTLPGRDIALETPDGAGLVRFQPYVLPTREAFSSEQAFHLSAGPRRWNAQQGLYIYRSNRLIQSGGWSRMRTPDEHLKLARASIDFFPDLDLAFEVNVAKARANLPAALREKLREPIDELVRAAQIAYRNENHLGQADRESTERKYRSALEDAARRAGAMRALRSIVRELDRTRPEVARRLGW